MVNDGFMCLGKPIRGTEFHYQIHQKHAQLDPLNNLFDTRKVACSVDLFI